MKKVLYVAQREFLATAGTKAFIFGILVTPLVVGVLILLVPWFSHQDAPAIGGSVAVIDPTGQGTGGLAAYLAPARIEERRREAYQRVQDAMPPALRSASPVSGPGRAHEGGTGRRCPISPTGSSPSPASQPCLPRSVPRARQAK